MPIELAKTYKPADVEKPVWSAGPGPGFSCRARGQGRAVLHRDPAAERDRGAAPGARAQ